MVNPVGQAYDGRAAEYAALAWRDLDRPGLTTDRERLAAFADRAMARHGGVLDLGCGPGHVTGHLASLGLQAAGYDVSKALLAEARQAFPGLDFEYGDLADIAVAQSSAGGVLSRYSLIHMQPHLWGDVFAHWFGLLEIGAPVMVSFFAAGSIEEHGEPFDHAVATAYAAFPPAIAAGLVEVGFVDVEITVRDRLPEERAMDHATLLARKPES